MSTQRRHAIAAVGLVITLAACVTVSTESSTTTTLATTTTEATTTSTAAATTTTTEAPTTTVAPTTTTTLPAFPSDLDSLEHGGEVWAVVLAGSSDFEDPALVGAVADAEEAGYATGPTDCDEGAAEALGQPQGNYTVSVYFADEATAQQALAAFEARAGSGVVAQVRTFCLD